MALPTYTRACFRLPKTTCQQIESVLADFWWRNKQDSRGMHWKAWKHLSRPKAEGGIGFKDIEAFNLALLGKQLWRMLTKEDTLLARVFKARYFSKTDPLRAPLGSRPSFAWRSIHAAQELIKQGARAVIGSGEKTDIWQNQWLDSKPARPIRATKRVHPQLQGMTSSLLRVRDLVDVNGREWRQDVLEMLFNEEDQRKIMEIRPGGRATHDNYTWDYTKTGCYSVKSGYWVQTQVINQRNATPEVSEPSLNPLYQQIWKLQASPKVLHFLWKCLSNCLSVAGNLFHRHLSRDSSCPRCPDHAETVNHLLFKCTFARLVWAISPVPMLDEGEWAESLYTNLDRVFQMGNQGPNLAKPALLIPWLLWQIWKNRNELVFNGKEFDAQEVLNKAKEDQQEWERRGEMENSGTSSRDPPRSAMIPKENVKWKKPPPDWVKCNTDGAWPSEGQRGGIGWVLRDSKGRVLWAGARAIPRPKTVMNAEIESLRWDVLTLSRFRYRKVIFESDAQQLVNLLNNGEEWPHFNPQIQDIKSLLPLFHEVRFVFTPREGNKVADRVARKSFSFENNDPKLYSIVPSWLNPIVESDIEM